ncbi:hypothetical protein CI102_2735 [Trichoderma harzianum]|uniref:Carbohydrate-binding module family 18 protein n=1 Tax=Trichoderma harzianum CBS 226.95 TaxID=983964 RepID=A0A2T3ZTZ4_TRIHA|nr:hypothetical protein M431DRAFT_100337 [Trichoderma harzianum CBS 226.95]PKK53009.1 hypothetical protein CI102_2735 [Trichoderma harzianum]PTB48263.1 hypothetical protein M431DRAFT_100337 [Trichoderma harzianum CBS 226.95]
MRCSLHTLLLLSLSSTTLAATNLFSRKPPARLLAQLSPSSPFHDASSHFQDASSNFQDASSHFQDASAVVIAAQCRPGEIVCNDGCMPSVGVCCTDGGGGFCKQGFSCVADGCCPIGHVCGDEITCDLGEVPCGEKKCMPKDGVCCPSGSYCQAGEECFQNGFDHYCQRVGGSGDPSDGGGSKTTGGTIGIAETSSSWSQSTSLSKTTQGEAPASTSAETQGEAPASTSAETQAEEATSTSTSPPSSSSTPINHPIVTPFLPNPSTTSTTTTEVISSSTTAATAATTTSGGSPAVVKMSGVTLALVFVSTIMLVL